MKNKVIFLSGWILWIITMIYGFSLFIQGKSIKTGDNRTAIVLNSNEKDLVLSEMRILLSVIQETMMFLSREDYVSASNKSKEAGMDLVNSLAASEKSILLKLPIEFKKLGMGTHDSFDDLSESIREKKSYPTLMKEMGELTSRCVTCHKNYKIELEK